MTQLKSRGPSNLAEKYEEELRRLRQAVDKLTHERAQAEMMRDNYANESEQWHEKYDEELVSFLTDFELGNLENFDGNALNFNPMLTQGP